jgi:hypothetical protein
MAIGDILLDLGSALYVDADADLEGDLGFAFLPPPETQSSLTHFCLKATTLFRSQINPDLKVTTSCGVILLAPSCQAHEKRFKILPF